MKYKIMILLMTICSAWTFARYDTLDFSGDKVHYSLINRSNNTVTVDTVRLFKLKDHALQWSNAIVFDTSSSSTGAWNWSLAPYRYYTGSFRPNDSVGIFGPETPIKIERNDTLIIRHSSQVGLVSKSLDKVKNVSEFMKMVFSRSDKKNDTMIVKLNFTKSGHAMAAEQSKTGNDKVAADYLINGEKLSVIPRANMMVMRKESKANPSMVLKGHPALHHH
jgi:hypothetical protein